MGLTRLLAGPEYAAAVTEAFERDYVPRLRAIGIIVTDDSDKSGLPSSSRLADRRIEIARRTVELRHPPRAPRPNRPSADRRLSRRKSRAGGMAALARSPVRGQKDADSSSATANPKKPLLRCRSRLFH
jgi:hypothetical protein